MGNNFTWVRKGDSILITGQVTQKGTSGNGIYTVTWPTGEDVEKNVAEAFEYKIGDILVHKFGAKYEVVAIDLYTPTKKPFSFKLKNLSKGCTDAPKWVERQSVYKDYEPDNQMHRILYGKR